MVVAAKDCIEKFFWFPSQLITDIEKSAKNLFTLWNMNIIMYNIKDTCFMAGMEKCHFIKITLV